MPTDTLPPDDLRTLAHGVVMPALRWDGSSYAPHGETAGAGALVSAGVAGFILFGGTADAARELTTALRARADRPLLFGADLERGAGQQFAGATPLPPAGALGSLDDPDVTRAAADLTAREARALGVDLLFAPVCDVAAEPDNHGVGPRAFAADPAAAARHVRAWVEGARAAGVHPCAKHFPGHGRTVGDSHVETVRIEADRATVEAELAPFRAALDAGASLVMPGHLAVPALDASGDIATVSRPMLGELLRGELGFDGVVVSDALFMGGAGELAATAVAAMRARVDLLEYPEDPAVAVDALVAEAEVDAAFATRLREAWTRVASLARPVERGEVGAEADVSSAAGWAAASVRRVRGELPAPGPVAPLRVIDIDDDLGGPWPTPERTAFRAGLTADPGGPTTVVALYADTRGWKGRAGLSAGSRRGLAAVLSEASGDVHVVVFGGPRVVDDVPEGPTVWIAWGGEPLMQRAAAVRLRAEADAGGTPA